MIIGGLSRRRRRYRRGQIAVLFALATLVVVAAAIGPLFERAVEQSTLRATLGSADRVSRGVTLAVGPNVTASQAEPAGRTKDLFLPAVHTYEVPATILGQAAAISTAVVYRDGQCQHLHLASGRCAQAVGEVMVSAPVATALHLHLNSHVPLHFPDSNSVSFAFKQTTTVVGIYQPFAEDDDYWFGASYSSTSGIAENSEGIVADAFFAGQPYVLSLVSHFEEQAAASYIRSFVTLALRPDRVGIDDIPVLRRLLATDALSGSGGPVQVQSALSQYLDQIEDGRRAARTIVFPDAISLALLAAIAFGVVVAAAADQRRPELALARLRGNGVAATARIFVRELGVPAVAAVVPGVVLAWALSAVACRVWLTSAVHPEIRLPVVAAAIGAVAAMIAIVVLIGRRASSQQITDMLRQLPSRASRRGLGIAEAMLVVAALVGLLAVLNGGRHGPLAALTPTLLAVVLGMGGSRLLVMAARRTGSRGLWRGRLVRAFAALNIGRRPGGRLTVTVLCVATALLVFAGQQWSVASTNRHQRAAAETGAAVTLDVTTPTVQRLIAAVRAGDPNQTFATPVVEIDPPGIGAVPTMAVDPATFGEVASWGRASLHPSAGLLASVQPHINAPAVTFAGHELQLQLASASFRVLARTDPDGPQSVGVRLDFRRADGQIVPADFGPLPQNDSGPQTLTSTVACEDGCHLTGIEVTRPLLNQGSAAVQFTVVGIAPESSSPLSLGKAADWATTTIRSQFPGVTEETSMTAADAITGVQFSSVDDGTGASMHYLELPVAAPALLAGAAPETKDGLGYLTGATLDGGVGRLSIVGTVPFVPELGPSGLIVDLNLAAQTSMKLDPTAHAEVWLRSVDSSRERRVGTALRAAGITVIARHTTAHAAGTFARSAPGWSALFALVAGVLAEILAIGLLVLLVLTSRRERQRDLAAMRLLGLSTSVARRSTALELVVLVVTGVLSGAVAGIVGAAVSLKAIPIFTVDATVPLPLTFTLQPLWFAGVIVLSVVLLVPAAAALGRWIAGRVRPEHAVGEVG